MAQSQNSQHTSPQQAYNNDQWGAEDCTGLWGDDDYCHEVLGSDETGYAFIDDSVGFDRHVTTTGADKFTLFVDPDRFADTYILDVNGEECYVWGATPAYYDVWFELYGYNCEHMPAWD